MVLAGLILLSGSVRCWGLPLLGSTRDVEGVRVYSDSASPSTLYYAPGKLSVASDSTGTPQVSFLQMRYMGTSVTGDKGEFRTRSILSFRVKMTPVTGVNLAQVKAKLRQEGVNAPNLRPLPIRKVESTLNYTPLAETPPVASTTSPEPESLPVGSGAMESPEDAKPAGGYWDERVFTISPDDATSQALWDALRTGKVILSLSYAFYSDGIMPEEEKPAVEGNIAIPETEDGPPLEEQAPDPHIVLADTLAVTVAAAEFPHLFKQIDINESVPANYAALSVYCYDFNNELRPDLFEKVVAIQAKSVTGKPLTAEAAFSRASPDVCSVTVRFRFAVSLKDPYQFRIREVTSSGEEKTSAWQPGKPWSQMLDVTTPPEEQPKPAENSDSGDKQ